MRTRGLVIFDAFNTLVTSRRGSKRTFLAGLVQAGIRASTVMLAESPGGAADSVITLGGEDERTLWDAFHRGCSDDLSSRVRHIYLRPIPMPSCRSPWQERALSARTDRSTLSTYLANRTPSDRADLLEWLLKTAIRLPAALNPGFGEGLDPALRNVDALLRGPVSELPPATVAAIAKAVVEWLNV